MFYALITLFAVNFAAGDAIPPQMILDGTWAQNADGLLIGADGASFHVDAIWTDYTYQVDFILLEPGSVHLVSRARAENPCEGFQVIFTQNEARLGGVSGAGCAQETTLAITAIEPQQRFSARVELVGSEIRAYLNDEALFGGSSSRFSMGGVGLLLRDGARIAISSVSVELSGGAPGILAGFDSEPENVLSELQTYGLVPEDGRMLFEENHVFVRGGGYNVIPLAQHSPRADVVLGGELSFRRGEHSSPEACIITARADDEIDNGVSLRFMDSGAVMLADQSRGGAFTVLPLNLDLSTSHYVLMILIGERMTAYVDGHLLVEAMPVADRAGIFALAGRGSGLSFRCDVFGMWVYAFDQ